MDLCNQAGHKIKSTPFRRIILGSQLAHADPEPRTPHAQPHIRPHPVDDSGGCNVYVSTNRGWSTAVATDST